MIAKRKKVLVLGSGALKIGEAGEFDYSGSQAIKAIKEEGIYTILVNPNVATIQTSKGFADRIYFLPINAYFVGKIIEKERPYGILLSCGGQTALNCGVELYKRGILEKYNVKVLGTPVRAIINTEDRDLFVKRLKEVNIKVPRSIAVTSVKAALRAADKIRYPVIVRSAYALGGLGSGIAFSRNELEGITSISLTVTKQVLIEEYLEGWKEIEFEVVRDGYDNCITVCSMENIDPMGIHTGESFVIAPAQTMNNKEYHKLRALSIKVVRHLGIVGECNIQFALNPYSDDYRVIEVNARLSRSSALASKASGYPLAFISTKLGLGYSLIDLENTITKVTKSCFEPALDYVVIKVPRWDLEKFVRVSKRIGSGMKSVGEVMAIGRTFEETIQKAIRMLNIGMNGLVCNDIKFRDLDKELKEPTDKRFFAIVEAIKNGYELKRIYDLTKIDLWFLQKIKNVIEFEEEIKRGLTKETLLRAKKLGFSDLQIAILLNKKEDEIRAIRRRLNIRPFVKQIDTLAGEFPAKTNYLYLTYNGQEDDIKFNLKKNVIVLGSGAYKIGSSVEFDWCCVNAVLTLKKMKYNTITINYNPETVSTDYDMCDRLYFDELSLETVIEIYAREKPEGIIISMGGQIPNNLALKLHREKVKILGTSPISIDNAEDRHKFSKLLDKLNIAQPEWKELTSSEDAKRFVDKVGYPVLVRPSYVLSGAAMSVASNDEELAEYLEKASRVNREHPIVISKFITGAREIEIDAVANCGEIVVYAISEHVENAGVHSGDATMVLPPQKTYLATIRKIKRATRAIAKALNICGPFNIQFIAKENEIKVIECNLRASRSFPFVSKVFKTNFIDFATRIIMNEKYTKPEKSIFEIDYVGVKAPQFSFARLKEADPILGVEMASTGEVGCLGDTIKEAFLKSIISTGFIMPKKNILVSIGGERNKAGMIESMKILQRKGFNLYATEHTKKFYDKYGIKTHLLHKIYERKEPNILTYLRKRKLDLVIDIMEDKAEKRVEEDTYVIRRNAVDFSIPLINNLQAANLLVNTLYKYTLKDLKIKAWDEYQ